MDARSFQHKIPYTELSAEDRMDSVNEFLDSLFNSIDYSLLIIFTGLFVVVANIDATGLPRLFWKQIVGNRPFQTFNSIMGISAFVLIASQTIGNVPVVQIAKPNIEILEGKEKELAWALISFVSTIGGNLCLTGSAANIIVVEKAKRLDVNIGEQLCISFDSHHCC
jgi:Na+/H+ antiporter NhaD/arsenite permease-like protein